MKKYLSILLLCAMLLGLLSACGSPAQTPAEPDAPAGQDTPALRQAARPRATQWSLSWADLEEL